MSKNKLTIDFDCFSYMAEDIKKLGGNLKEPVEKSLIASRDYINEKTTEAMSKHIRTGRTIKSIKNDNIDWDGYKASIGVGFDIPNGGLPSIFLMYGTPRMKKDTKLYNAVYGKQTKEEISKIQKNIFQKYFYEVLFK